MTNEDVVKKAIENHYRLSGRAISKRELEQDVLAILGMEMPPSDFEQSLGILVREKLIEELESGWFKPSDVDVNKGPFPKAKDIVPTPKQKKS